MTGLETLKKDTFVTIKTLDAMAMMESMATLGTMTGLDEIKKRTLNTVKEIENIKKQVLDSNKVLEKFLTQVREDIKGYEDALTKAKADFADGEFKSLEPYIMEARKMKCVSIEGKIEELWKIEKLVQNFFQDELIKA